MPSEAEACLKRRDVWGQSRLLPAASYLRTAKPFGSYQILKNKSTPCAFSHHLEYQTQEHESSTTG